MIENKIKKYTLQAFKDLYNHEVSEELLSLENTNKEFTGDYTLVVFPLLRFSKKSPEQTAGDVGEWLKNEMEEIFDYNVIKGFLNLSLSVDFWKDFFLNNCNILQ